MENNYCFLWNSDKKIGSKRDLQISGLDRKTPNKIAKVIETRSSSKAHNPFEGMDVEIDSA